jgi:DNA polymerase III epsilon subunit-like protein
MAGYEFTDCMVDIETTGLQPDKAAIIQIGAVPFRYDDMAIDTKSMFKQSLTMPRDRFWTDNTQEFWLGQNREVYFKIMGEARYYREVILEFHAWAVAKPNMRFWCKGLNFDWNFIESYFIDHDLAMPFNFREAKDLRSFISGRYDKPGAYEPDVDRVGSHHDALSDCLTQLRLLAKVKEETCINKPNLSN